MQIILVFSRQSFVEHCCLLQNGELHKALEQEKSKNKNLTQELTKFQVSKNCDIQFMVLIL